jgi:DNA-binding XRE family transcriptional regulator
MTVSDSTSGRSAVQPERWRVDGEILRLARNHLGLTQADLAKLLGVSARTIVNWETTAVPDHRLPRVERRIGPAIRVAIDLDRSARMAPTEEALVQPGRSPEVLRDHLGSFTDLDLLSELHMRAVRREAERVR